MPQLGPLQSAGAAIAPAFKSEPANLPITAPPPPPVNTAALSRAQAQAALMGTVSKTLSELPSVLLGNYMQGKKIGAQAVGMGILSDVAAGHQPASPPLPGTSIGPDGSVSYTTPNPIDVEAKSANIAHVKAETKALGQTPYDQIHQQYQNGGGDAPIPTTGGQQGNATGTIFGLVPSGKLDAQGNPIPVDDPQDSVDAAKGIKGFDATKGAWGDNIKDPSLEGVALSPAKLQAAGVKLGKGDPDPSSQGYMVELTKPDGTIYRAPIVDKNGTDSVDMTLGLYRKMGGRMDVKGGENIPLQYKIVKTGEATAPGALSKSGAIDVLPQSAGVDSGAPAGALSGGVTPPATSAVTPGQRAAIEPIQGMNGYIYRPTPGTTFLALQGHKDLIPIKDPSNKNVGYSSLDEMNQAVAAQGGTVTASSQDADGRFHADKIIPGGAKLSKATMQIVSESGYQPAPGEPEAQVASNARTLMEAQNKVPPEIRPSFASWATGLAKNPTVQTYTKARDQENAVNDAMKDGMNPAAALGVIDSYVKAMSGGRATKGMTSILSEAQPLREKIGLFMQGLTGTDQQNAVLPTEMAKQIKDIVGRISTTAKEQVEGQIDGDQERWSVHGVAPGAVKKAYAPILSGKKSSFDDGTVPPPMPVSPSGVTAQANPAAVTAAKGQNAQIVLQKYNAGQYDGPDKVRAEALLRAAGLLPGRGTAKPAIPVAAIEG